MAFDFLGTFNTSGLERFKVFARAQVGLIDERIAHLESELDRVGVLQFSFDAGGVPQGYSVARPPDSLISKLVAAYEALGGDAFRDLKIRATTQPVFVVKADESGSPTRMSSGEIISQPGLADAPTAELMHQAKAWISETLDYRRNHIERKVRRAVDYSDQLANEITQLKTIRAADTVEGSLENIFKTAADYISDRTYRSVYDDKKQDPDLLKVNAPLASYESGPDQPENPDQRGTDGFQDATDGSENA